MFFFLMLRRPPRSTRTDTLFPYTTLFRSLDGLILSGSVAVDHIPAGGDPAGLIAALNSPFEPARTPFDWLSRDDAEVDRYLEDPLCVFGLTEASFASLGAEGPRLADPAAIAAIPARPHS